VAVATMKSEAPLVKSSAQCMLTSPLQAAIRCGDATMNSRESPHPVNPKS
jgi:hypothetical protein